MGCKLLFTVVGLCMDRLLVDLFDVEIDSDSVACPGEISDAKEDRETQQHLNDARW